MITANESQMHLIPSSNSSQLGFGLTLHINSQWTFHNVILPKAILIWRPDIVCRTHLPYWLLNTPECPQLHWSTGHSHYECSATVKHAGFDGYKTLVYGDGCKSLITQNEPSHIHQRFCIGPYWCQCFCGKSTVKDHEFCFCSPACARADSFRALGGQSDYHYRNVIRKAYIYANLAAPEHALLRHKSEHQLCSVSIRRISM
ncbi:uncharacterized protein BJ212DRAFT_93702 [Suillus subaureus]|uniref:Uncharacterized protein n=1 Tax=Suillus subaureus TaxID=48587 RepID=A0A9P7EDR2_9AGAM|nr:uncharacterized protein BJ212DRAFT_93702 [Suillus subaureus]KAG1818482.1 hypothetical protein BJ212DRAFT_93702 [Suillus subaureus]